MHRILLLLFALMGMAACGGNSKPAPAANTSPPPSSSSGVGTSPVTSPAVVNAAAGQTASGVDITVSAPAATPAPNAQDLGVASGTGAASAFNTGDVIHRGQSGRVLLFGPGLSGAMQVTIRGPADIQISNLTSITSRPPDNTPGISFTAVVSPTAALGARTVVLQTSSGDVTTFTGGLEVVP